MATVTVQVCDKNGNPASGVFNVTAYAVLPANYSSGATTEPDGTHVFYNVPICELMLWVGTTVGGENAPNAIITVTGDTTFNLIDPTLNPASSSSLLPLVGIGAIAYFLFTQ